MFQSKVQHPSQLTFSASKTSHQPQLPHHLPRQMMLSISIAAIQLFRWNNRLLKMKKTIKSLNQISQSQQPLTCSTLVAWVVETIRKIFHSLQKKKKRGCHQSCPQRHSHSFKLHLLNLTQL